MISIKLAVAAGLFLTILTSQETAMSQVQESNLLFPTVDSVELTYIEPLNLIVNEFVIEMKTPEIYYKWWKDIQKCVKLKATDDTYDSIKFIMIRTISGFVINGGPGRSLFIGYTFPWHNQILIAEPFISSEKVVKHEMVHLLMWHSGKPGGHDVSYFDKKMVEKCNI